MGLFSRKTDKEILAEGRSLYIKGDLAGADRKLLKLAMKGNDEACYWVGRISLEVAEKYRDTKRREVGKQYLEKAAKQGNKDACALLAKEFGVPNPHAAVEDKTEAEARAKAEAEEKAKAEAKAKTEAEARAKAEAEARAKAEAEAKEKAEAEAKDKAEAKAEAKAKAEAEAKAEVEAKAKVNAKSVEEHDKIDVETSDFVPRDLNLETIREIFQDCIVNKETKKVRSIILQRVDNGFDKNSEEVYLDAHKLSKNAASVRYLFGQLYAIHRGDALLNAADILKKYNRYLWSKEKSAGLFIFWLGIGINLISEPSANQFSCIMLDKIEPTLSPKDPDFPEWWKQNGAKWQEYFNSEKMFMKGMDLYFDKNFAEAIKSFRLAAEHGHTKAQMELATMYEEGNGVEINQEEAVKWLKISAKRGSMAAKRRLTGKYLFGEGIEKNLKEGYKWCKLCAEQGCEHSRDILKKIEIQIEQERLSDLAQSEIEQGNYVKGLEISKQLYKLQNENGVANADLANYIGMQYYDGKNIEKDMKEAMYWLQIAGDGGIEAARGVVVMTYLFSAEYKSVIDEEKVKCWTPEVFSGLHKEYKCDISALTKQIQETKKGIQNGELKDFYEMHELTPEMCGYMNGAVIYGKFSQGLYLSCLILAAQLPLNQSYEVDVVTTSMFAETLEGFKRIEFDKISTEILFLLDALKQVGILTRNDSDEKTIYRIVPEMRECFLQVRDMWASYEKSVTGKSKTRSEEYMEFQEAMQNYRKS